MTDEMLNPVAEEPEAAASGQEIPAEAVEAERVEVVEASPAAEAPRAGQAVRAEASGKMERPDLLTLTAVYHFLCALPGLFFGCLLLALPVPAILASDARGIGLFAALMGMAVAIFFTGGIGIIYAVVGWGLLKMKSWARWAAIALAILFLPAFPIGTVAGGLLLAYLLQDETRRLFQ